MSKVTNIKSRNGGSAIDIEAQAEAAKVARVERCIAEVNKVLEAHRCQVQCAVEISGQLVPLSVLLNLPNRVQVVSK